jgi:hypothetical protein
MGAHSLVARAFGVDEVAKSLDDIEVATIDGLNKRRDDDSEICDYFAKPHFGAWHLAVAERSAFPGAVDEIDPDLSFRTSVRSCISPAIRL